MVVNKSSATNSTTPAVKEEYAAPATTLVTARLFVMTISCAWNRIHITWGRIFGALEDKAKQSSLFFRLGTVAAWPQNDGLRLERADHLGASPSHGRIR